MVQALSKSNTDSTPVDAVDPDISGFKLVSHTLLLRPVHVEGKTKGGVLLAGKTQHDLSYLMNVCKVLAVGPTAYIQEKFEKTGPWCKVGDYVLLPRLEGQKIKLHGTPLTIASCDRILAVIDDPASLDPSFNISTDGRL